MLFCSMAKAIKLNIKNNFDFVLIGLVTSEPIYRLSWLLNQEFGLQLTDYKPIQLLHKQTKVIQSFTRFAYYDEANAFYELIQNRGGNGLFVEEQKNVDFLLKITDGFVDGAEFASRTKVLENISLVIKLQPGSLKSKDRLISYSEEF